MLLSQAFFKYKSEKLDTTTPNSEELLYQASRVFEVRTQKPEPENISHPEQIKPLNFENDEDY